MEERAQGVLVVFGQPPVQHHLAGEFRIPPLGDQLLVEVSHQRFGPGRSWRGRPRSRSDVCRVVVVDADHFLLFFSGLNEGPLSELVLLVCAVLDPVAGSPAVLALDVGAALDVVAEHVALEAADAFGALGTRVALLVADGAGNIGAVSHDMVAAAFLADRLLVYQFEAFGRHVIGRLALLAGVGGAVADVVAGAAVPAVRHRVLGAGAGAVFVGLALPAGDKRTEVDVVAFAAPVTDGRRDGRTGRRDVSELFAERARTRSTLGRFVLPLAIRTEDKLFHLVGFSSLSLLLFLF